MSEIDKRGMYITQIPFDDVDYLKGVVVIKSSYLPLNKLLEDNIRSFLRDVYYGEVELIMDE